MIKDFSNLEFVDPMIDLKELNLRQNKIQTIQSVKNVPNLEQLNLSENPISLIFPDAFAQINELGSLIMDKVQIKNPWEDLEFLKKLEGNLSMLSMNYAFPKQNVPTIEVFSFLKMSSCLNLHLKGVGLEELEKINEIFPALQILDVMDNKIHKMSQLEMLKQMPEIAELNVKNNPVCFHENVNEMILEYLPQIEVVNDLTLKEPGQKYKENKEIIMRKLQNAYKMGEEITEGDDLLLQEKLDKGGPDNDNDEGVHDQNGQIDFQKVLMKQREFNAVIKKAQEKQGSSQMKYNELEQKMGLRLMTLNEVEDSKHDDLKNDPIKDAELFREVC